MTERKQTARKGPPRQSKTAAAKKTRKKPLPVATEIDMTNVTPVDTCIAYKVVAATQEGQIMIADLMRRFGFARHTTLVPGDPETTAFHEGGRVVIIHIGRQIDADPASFEDQNEVEM